MTLANKSVVLLGFGVINVDYSNAYTRATLFLQKKFGQFKKKYYLCSRILRWREMSLIFRVDSDILNSVY